MIQKCLELPHVRREPVRRDSRVFYERDRLAVAFHSLQQALAGTAHSPDVFLICG